MGDRRKGEIGIMAMRAADVVGDHTVLFAGPGERIEFTHRSTSRLNYATGALMAARFISKKKNGLFTMADVLGLPKL
jgi:4-hydroxy-tetrahydrodipicolinate reductase